MFLFIQDVADPPVLVTFADSNEWFNMRELSFYNEEDLFWWLTLFDNLWHWIGDLNLLYSM